MLGKIIDILLVNAIIICSLAIIFVYEPQGDNLKQQLEKLHHQNDSLYTEISKQDSAISELQSKADNLTNKISNQKTKIVYIDKKTKDDQDKISLLSKSELVSYFNHRYSKDTVTNPSIVAQPVLASAAKDLVEFDGAKEKLAIKDTIISLTEAKVVLKDSIISKYINKETNYKSIITNKDKEINLFIGENKKLKKRNRLHKATITGLSAISIYLLLSK